MTLMQCRQTAEDWFNKGNDFSDKVFFTIYQSIAMMMQSGWTPTMPQPGTTKALHSRTKASMKRPPNVTTKQSSWIPSILRRVSAVRISIKKIMQLLFMLGVSLVIGRKVYNFIQLMGIEGKVSEHLYKVV
jgi:hypothetical protein